MVNPIKLSYINGLKESLFAGSALIQVLQGPRQVGKTTSILKMIGEHFAGKAHYVAADGVFQSNANWLREQWILARDQKKILVVDEIQKVHGWSETIKSLHDESKRQKNFYGCVLLGSSSLDIQKGLSESLTGRFQLTRAHHWNFEESNRAYGISFDEYLQYGGYPGSYPFIKTPKEWVNYVRNSIIATVVEKDILQDNTVKNPALFRQAFDVLMSYPAQEISYTKLLGKLQERGNVELVKHYMHLYEGAYLIKILQKYSGSPLRLKSSSPKIIPLAPCFYYTTIQSEYTASEAGRVFELIVGAQLVRTGEELYYWREGNAEVDYILKKGRKLWAIEVKSGRKKSTKGLEAFAKKFPDCAQVLITPENYGRFEKEPMTFLENL